MPFDSLSSVVATTDEDIFAIYRQRREAAAEIWRNLDPTEKFDISDWVNECGTTACAIGWLAAKSHDGWHWLMDIDDRSLVPNWNDGHHMDHQSVYHNAAVYFAMTETYAVRCFCGVYYGSDIKMKDITPAMVIARVLTTPYTIWK